MARFDRYFLSQLLSLFGFFSLVLVGVYWINRAVALFDQIIADGQSAGVFVELTLLTLPNVIRMVLPLSAFVAAVYVTNRMMSESEVVVVQAAGFGPYRLMRAPLVFGLVVTAFLAVLAHWLVPASRAELTDRRSEIAQNVTARFLNEGRFMHPTDGMTLYIREITPEGELQGLFLSDARKASVRTVYTAARALLVKSRTGPKLVMVEGLAQIHDTATGQLSTTRFSDFAFDLADLIDSGGGSRRDERQLPTIQLLYPDEATLEMTRKPVSVLLYEAHSRFAQPFLGLVGAMIGFSAMLAGGFSRFDLWRQVALAIVLLVVVQFLDNALADLALANAALVPLVYVPPVLGVGLALALLAWSGRTRRRLRAGVAA